MEVDLTLEVYVENLTEDEACKLEKAIKKIAQKYGVEAWTLERQTQENPVL